MDTAIISMGGQDDARPVVTLVTALAETRDISDAEYAGIYARVAQGRSLRNVELALRSAVSFGWWGKYANGEKVLDRERKNELRRWARENGGPELADLPLSVGEAVAARVHPDAAVYQVGAGQASRVVLVGADVPVAVLRLNGNCTLTTEAPTLEARQAECNRRYRARSTKSLSVSRSTWERASAGRQARGLTWDAYVARAEVVDELVAALALVDGYLDVDEDVMEDPDTWGEYERLAATVRKALDAVRNGEQP